MTPLAVKAPDDNTLATVLDPRFDASRVALFDTSASVPRKPFRSNYLCRSPSSRVWTRRGSGDLAIDLDAGVPAGATLVVSENYYPGWTSTVDGRPGAIGRVDYSLIGVPLAAGARRVELHFGSPSYETGKAITLAAIAASLLMLIAGAVVDRRRRA